MHATAIEMAKAARDPSIFSENLKLFQFQQANASFTMGVRLEEVT